MRMKAIGDLFFGRLADGSVRILRLRSTPLDAPDVNSDFRLSECMVDSRIPSETWSSIVASMSARGESSLRYYAALAFHNDLVDKTEVPR